MTTVALTSPYSQHLKENPVRSHTSQIGDHQSIFKYVSLNSDMSWKHFENTISKCILAGTTNQALNDPFEISPCQIDDLDPQIIKNCHSFFDTQGFSKEVKPLAGDFENVHSYRDLAQSIIDTYVNNTHVISFSDKMDSPLLWAHYANSHQGACLHFIGRAFSSLPHRTGLVSYARQRPFLPLSLVIRLQIAIENSVHRDQRTALETEIDRSMFFTKPSDWAYEGEYRITYSTESGTPVEFDRAGLLEVIIGCRMPNEDEEKLKSMLRDNHSTVKVRRAKPSDRTFAVDVVAS